MNKEWKSKEQEYKDSRDHEIKSIFKKAFGDLVSKENGLEIPRFADRLVSIYKEYMSGVDTDDLQVFYVLGDLVESILAGGILQIDMTEVKHEL